jgi:hypothetical protein
MRNCIVSSAETDQIQCGNGSNPVRKRTKSSAETDQLQCGNRSNPMRKTMVFSTVTLSYGKHPKINARKSTTVNRRFQYKTSKHMGHDGTNTLQRPHHEKKILGVQNPFLKGFWPPEAIQTRPGQPFWRNASYRTTATVLERFSDRACVLIGRRKQSSGYWDIRDSGKP